MSHMQRMMFTQYYNKNFRFFFRENKCQKNHSTSTEKSSQPKHYNIFKKTKHKWKKISQKKKSKFRIPNHKYYYMKIFSFMYDIFAKLRWLATAIDKQVLAS